MSFYWIFPSQRLQITWEFNWLVRRICSVSPPSGSGLTEMWYGTPWFCSSTFTFRRGKNQEKWVGGRKIQLRNRKLVPVQIHLLLWRMVLVQFELVECLRKGFSISDYFKLVPSAAFMHLQLDPDKLFVDKTLCTYQPNKLSVHEGSSYSWVFMASRQLVTLCRSNYMHVTLFPPFHRELILDTLWVISPNSTVRNAETYTTPGICYSG